MALAARALRQLGHHDDREPIADRNTTSLSDLLHEVLVVLMQHVPPQQRLAVCARLSSKFRRAAAAATTSIEHHATSISTVCSLDAYLQAHGSAVLSINLKPPLTAAQRLPYALQRLPCPGLLRLQLTDTLVQLTAVPGSKQPGILASCQGLTCLSLLNCNVLDRSEHLGGLSVLQDLQELMVAWGPDCSRRKSQPLTLLPGSLLSQLVRLKRVYLSSPIRFASLEHLSCLAHLQQLRVVLAADAKQERFSGVSQLQRLTSLSLSCHQSKQSIGFNETRGLYQLTSLQALDVWACKAFRPSVLQHMSSLRDLMIQRPTLPGGADGTSALLRVLPCLAAVTGLDLSGTLQHPAVQLEDYTALACLSNLAILVLSDCNLPSDMWRQLEETGMPMRSTRRLAIDNASEPLDSACLSSLVKCFPSLTGLSCVNATKAGTHWTPLQQLPGLQALHMSGVSDADVPVLTSLQQLTDLKVLAPSSITDLGLLRLTALSQLELLHVSGNLSGVLTADASAAVVTNQAATGQAPDVANHLMRLCIKSSLCQPVLLAQLAGMNDLQQDLQDARSKLADAKGELSHTKSQLDALYKQHKAMVASVKAAADHEAKVQAREAAAADRDKQLQNLEASLTAREQQLQAQEQVLQSRTQFAEERERNMAAAAARVAGREAQVCARAAAAAGREHRLQGLETSLAAREQQLQARERDVEERERHTAAGNVAHREAQVQAREAAVADLNQRLMGLQASLESRELNIAAAAAKVAADELAYAARAEQLDNRLQGFAASERGLSARWHELERREYHFSLQQQPHARPAMAPQAPYYYRHPLLYRHPE